VREGSPETGTIERELDDTRTRLDATIGALQQRLAPGSMVDQAVEYFKEGGGVEFSRNLGRTMRDNPMPVALIGVGLGWLMLSSTRSNGHADTGGWRNRRWMRGSRFGGGLDHDMYGRDSDRWGEHTDTSVHQPMPYEAAAHDDLATKAHIAGTRVERAEGESEDLFQDRVHAARGSVLGVTRNEGEESHSFRQRVQEAMQSAAARVRSMAEDVGSAAGHLAGRGQSAARGLYEHGHSAYGEIRSRAGSAAGQVRGIGERTIDYVQEQPLLLGAIGVTVGAVIGMLVPASRYERRLAGSLRGQLSDSAREAASEAARGVGRVAEAVLDTAHDASRREGFTDVSGSGMAAAARERVADTAGRARHVVEETAAAGREALERELSGNGEKKKAAEGSAEGNGGPSVPERPAEHGTRPPSI
jgi:ElaB/YqjD/DUF883 family membrane-anchored ribosome-binding protein